MKVYTEHNWGADADGNRGITVTEYELEPIDDAYIVEQIQKQLLGWDYEDYPETLTVVIDGVEFDIDVKDYL